jgi:hypothetical protein
MFALEHDVIVSRAKGWQEGSGFEVAPGIHHTLGKNSGRGVAGHVGNGEEIGRGDGDPVTAVIHG